MISAIKNEKTIFASIAGIYLVLFLFTLSVTTPFWATLNNFGVINRVDNFRITTDTHYGLWKFCVNYHHSEIPDTCGHVNAQCHADIGFGNVLLFGSGKFGNCGALNAVRAFVILGAIFSFFGVLNFMFYLIWFKTRKFVVFCYFLNLLSGVCGMIAFSLFLNEFYFQKGQSSIFGVSPGASFYCCMVGWVVSMLVSLVLFPIWWSQAQHVNTPVGDENAFVPVSYSSTLKLRSKPESFLAVALKEAELKMENENDFDNTTSDKKGDPSEKCHSFIEIVQDEDGQNKDNDCCTVAI